MKSLIILPSFVLTLSCTNTAHEQKSVSNTGTNVQLLSLEQTQRPPFDTTLTINEQPVLISTKAISDDSVILKATINDAKIILADTIDGVGLAELKFPDFNRDGNADILLTYMGNNAIYLLYLFDPDQNAFIHAEDFERFPDAIQLHSNTELYCSYNRAGCADQNWESRLFKIEDHKAVELAYLYGRGCDFDLESEPQVIDVYKIIVQEKNRRDLVETISYTEQFEAYGDKWTFIEAFWNEHHKRFE